MKITETTSEFQKVETTTTVERIKCDVCGHAYPDDEWSGNEFSVNPGIERESHAFWDLGELFKAYHTKIPIHTVDDKYNGSTINVPEKDLFEVMEIETEIAKKRGERTEETEMSMEAMKNEYKDKIGSDNIYLVDGEIHHFRYILSAEATTDCYKHVCDDCFDVIFD